MNNVVEYILRMKDMMSVPMKGAASNAELALNRAGNASNHFNERFKRSTADSARSIAVLERGLRRLEYRRSIAIDTTQIERANHGIYRLKNEINRLQNLGVPGKDEAIGKGGSMLGSVIGGNLISGAISSGISGAKQIAIGSIMDAMDYGRSVKSFEVLTGNATRGRELAMELRKLKESTIVGAGVYKNAQTMLGFGVSEGEVIKRARQMGDIGMGDQGRMESLTLAYSQSQAAGRLMGQDLLQFVNAGFNPLSVMADKWKEFGFKSAQSIGQLKEQMEKGAISSQMVAKAFDLATAKGGKFHNMMGAIGETAGGQFQKLKGEWAAAKIDIGNSLMPIASEFMKAASSVLHFANIAKTNAEVLRDEHVEINTLIKTISSLNEGNRTRADLLHTLTTKYPQFFENIDKEKIANMGLLKILESINSEYDKKIAITSAGYKFMKAESDAKELRSLAEKAALQHIENEEGSFGKRKMHLGLLDWYKVNWLRQGGKSYAEIAADLEAKAKRLDASAAMWKYTSEVQNLTDSERFGLAMGLITPQDLQNGNGIGSSLTTTSGSIDSLSSPGVTHSGAKSINVYINKEMIGELSIHSHNIKEGVGELEDVVREVMLRTINSLESSN